MICAPHHWLVQPVDQKTPGSDFVDATCKRCGAERDFVAFSPVDLFSPRTATSAARRETAMSRLSRATAVTS